MFHVPGERDVLDENQGQAFLDRYGQGTLSGGRDGYAVVHRIERGLEFWAVSDVEGGDLAAFGTAFQAATAS